MEDNERRIYLPIVHKNDIIFLSYSVCISSLVSIRMYIPSRFDKNRSIVDDLITIGSGSIGISILEAGFNPDTHEMFDNVLEKGKFLDNYKIWTYKATKQNINYVLNKALERRYKEKYNIDFLEDFECNKSNVWHANRDLLQVIDESQLDEALTHCIEYKDIFVNSSYIQAGYGDFYKQIHKLKDLPKTKILNNNVIYKKPITYTLRTYNVVEKKSILKNNEVKTELLVDKNKVHSKISNLNTILFFLQEHNIIFRYSLSGMSKYTS